MVYSDKSQESPLLDDDDEHERRSERSKKALSENKRQTLRLVITAICAALVVFIVGFSLGAYYNISNPPDTNRANLAPTSCNGLSFRREWRSLDSKEKNDYIEAVKCLKRTSSYIDLNQTLYDDFPWVHLNFGEYSHDAAPFLAWHRYFIHTYEHHLQEQCGYTGHLTYWDWTLDWENITTAPVWDTETGFGGNGNLTMDPPVFDAYCVTEGPFARLEVPYFEHIYQPHCLLRGFDKHLTKFRTELRPEAVEKLLLSADYNSFNLGLENGPHVAIPKSINGDFSLHTAPFDPVFFLHHTQLDRIWWQWQQLDRSRRSGAYIGKAETNSTETASLDDILPMGGLAPDIRVADIMNTESGMLCYRY